MTTASGEHWRIWRVTSDGHLLSPFSALSADPRFRQPWPAGQPVRAWCDEHDEPPADGCECGIRGLPGPRDALASACMAGWLQVDTWDVPPQMQGRVVLAIGRIQLGGRLAGPSPNDPEPMVRAEHGTPAGTIYVEPYTGKLIAKTGMLHIYRPTAYTAGLRQYGLPVRPLGDLIRSEILGREPE